MKRLVIAILTAWVYLAVLGSGTTAQEWQIDADRWLRSHSVLWVGEDTAIQTVTRFAQVEGSPIVAPTIGSPLDPAAYRVPEAILELSQ